jgi:predicted dehydrogenase
LESIEHVFLEDIPEFSHKIGKVMAEAFHLVIGSGSIARRHIRNLQALFPEIPVACVSASGRPLEPEECGADKVYPDLAAAVEAGPAMAIVASPAPSHMLQAGRLLDARVPILIEKPLAHSLADIAPVWERLVASGVPVEVGYNLRYLPSAVVVKEWLDSGRLGRVYSVMAEVGQYLPDWRPQSDYRKNVSAQRRLGGGALLELSHEFDYLTWLFGRFDRAYCVSAKASSLEIDVEDRVDVVLSRSEGLVATVHLDFLQRVTTRTCKIIAEEATLLWNLATNSVSLLAPGKEPEVVFNDPGYDRNIMYLDELERFRKVAHRQAEPAVTVGEAAYIVSLVEALKTSSQSQQAVLIKEFEL